MLDFDRAERVNYNLLNNLKLVCCVHNKYGYGSMTLIGSSTSHFEVFYNLEWYEYGMIQCTS